MTGSRIQRDNRSSRACGEGSRLLSNHAPREANKGIDSRPRAGLVGAKGFTLGDPNSSAEREAEQTADQIVRSSSASTFTSSRSAPTSNHNKNNAHPILGEIGASLENGTQQWMQNRFKSDFSGIKIHTSENAQRSADSMQARAYTLGNHIAFSKGAYQPHTNRGKLLLAHELTHSLQQSNSPNVKFQTQQIVQRSPQTYIKAINKKPEPDWALAAEHLNGERKSHIRIILSRLPEMYRAKLNRAARKWPGLCSNIGRFTEKEYLKHIDPNAERVSDICPREKEKKKPKKKKRKSKLSKKNRALRRKSPKKIMAHKNYFENGIKSINYYYGDFAILNYADGSTMRLGLVPGEIKSPIKGVDFRSLKSEHLVLPPSKKKSSKGRIKFVPRGNEIEHPGDFTLGDFDKLVPEISRTIKFVYNKQGRIVPTEVNSITAPRLTQALRKADKQYIDGFTAMAKQLKVMEWVLIVHSLAASAPKAASALGKATLSIRILRRAKKTFTELFASLLKSGKTGNLIVQGVKMGSIRASLSGTELVVSRAFVKNVSMIPGRGKLVHKAFERAAIATAKSQGAKTVRVALHQVENWKWANHLIDTQKYAFEVIKTKDGFTKILTKVFTL